MAHALARDFEVQAALHLDDGNSMEHVEDCLAANYSSVMLDYSLRPFEENIEALQRVVALAPRKGQASRGNWA